MILGAAVRRDHRVPHYENVFTATGLGSPPLDVQFRQNFTHALEEMIVPSGNAMAGKCVHGVGYSYLNGVLEAGGFFDTSTKKGLWVAGDFSGGSDWPYVRIQSTNDRAVAQASTSLRIAQLMALILGRGVLDARSCDEMRDRLRRAARGQSRPGKDRDQSCLTRGAYQTILMTAGSSMRRSASARKAGGDVYSEICAVTGLDARTYVVAFQNFRPGAYRWEELISVIRNTITTYETP